MIAKNSKLTANQVNRAKRTLCGIAGCTCSGDAGTRGQQDGFEIEPMIDGITGQVEGAWIHFND